jgi:hypothetical protein
MEKRFLGSLRTTRTRDDTAAQARRVGRGGVFEYVKRQVLTADIGRVETLYREVQEEEQSAAGEAFDGVQLAGKSHASERGKGADAGCSVD